MSESLDCRITALGKTWERHRHHPPSDLSRAYSHISPAPSADDWLATRHPSVPFYMMALTSVTRIRGRAHLSSLPASGLPVCAAHGDATVDGVLIPVFIEHVSHDAGLPEPAGGT